MPTPSSSPPSARPIGKFLGGLADLPAPQLGAVARRRGPEAGRGEPPDQVDEVIMGNVRAGRASARTRRGRRPSPAGLPGHASPAFTVNKVCGSGLKAVMLAAQAIRAGDADLIVAGGMESMSRAPFLLFGTRDRLEVRRPEGGRRPDPRRPVVRVRELADGRGGRAHRGEVRRRRAPTRTASPPRATSGPRRRGRAGRSPPRSCRSRSAAGRRRRSVSQDEGIRPDTTPEGLAKLRAGVPRGRHRDGRQRLACSATGRRRWWSASAQAAEKLGVEAAGPDRGLRHERRRPEGHLHRPGAGGAAGAGEGRSWRSATSTCSS